MNKVWIRNGHTSAIWTYDFIHADELDKQGNPRKTYMMDVYLRGGQKLTFKFDSEMEQKMAYEQYKPI